MGSYQRPLETVVTDAVKQWASERAASLGQDPRTSTIISSLEDSFTLEVTPSRNDVLAMVEGAAEVVMRMMNDIRGFDKEPVVDLELVLMAMGSSPELGEQFREALQVRLARSGMVAAGNTDRLCSLSSNLLLVRGPSVPAPVAGYLRRVAHTYVNGYDAECISHCGSAMEQMLRSAVPYDLCERVLGPRTRRKSWYEFGERLDIAKRESLFHKGTTPSDKSTNKQLAKAAHAVWERRNAVIHKDSTLTERVDQSVRDTFRVVSALLARRDPERPPWL